MGLRNRTGAGVDQLFRSQEPITKGMVLTWGKLLGMVIPVVVALILSVWKFGGDTRAAEIQMTNTVSSLQESVGALKGELHETTEVLRALRDSAARYDERLKALERGH